jgi:Ser/Thr protein kinase RdoA (MazF antagonist)
MATPSVSWEPSAWTSPNDGWAGLLLLKHPANNLVGLGVAVGRLHAATGQAHPAYRDVLASVGSPDEDTSYRLPWPGVDRWGDVVAAWAELRFPDASVAAGDVALVHDRLATPRPFAALMHTDLNPSNVLVTPDGVKIVDFEGAAFGHVGFDASFLPYTFPTYSTHWATQPDAVVAQTDCAYRHR